ncbi:MAG: hypothetical protein COA79_24140 [Planctomycetota bacterium]|nr:MAG: hypothetical protein COA79_24140 [Planctomycetota bacterium]
MNSKSIIYGNNISDKAIGTYENILTYAKQIYPNHHLDFATPKNIDSVLKSTKIPTIIIPLLLINGYEYSTLKSKIDNINNLNITLTDPLLQNKKLQKYLFENAPRQTIFLAHGSNNKQTQNEYLDLESASKNYGSFSFCYFLGFPNFKDTIESKLSEGELINIKPLMFVSGKHINIDLKQNFLQNLNQKEWELASCLGDDQTFIKKILQIFLK